MLDIKWGGCSLPLWADPTSTHPTEPTTAPPPHAASTLPAHTAPRAHFAGTTSHPSHLPKFPPTTVRIHLMVQCSRQHRFLIYAMDKEPAKTADVPNLIDALGARARKGECTRLRCLCRDCPLRPASDFRDLPEQVDAEAELDEDHLDERDSDGGEEEISGSDDEPEALAQPGNAT